ncbi:MAG: pyridoxamine 5'-phosphate oxidase family protein [Candidatus Helarchaeota archaeon]
MSSSNNFKENYDIILNESIKYIEKNNILTIATANENGIPRADALEYANEGINIVILSRKDSWKVSNIRINSRVFYEIHHSQEINMESLKGIIGIQVEATAEIIEYSDENFMRYFNLMIKKFPIFKKFPENALKKRVILLLKPKKLWLLNYTNKFFHRDYIQFEN